MTRVYIDFTDTLFFETFMPEIPRAGDRLNMGRMHSEDAEVNRLLGERAIVTNITWHLVGPQSAYVRLQVETLGPPLTYTDTERMILDLISHYAATDGEHHKAWVLDQITRLITVDDYDAFVAQAKAGKDGPDTYDWNIGIAP
ncbi:hypothetical protein [Spirosoma sp.]|uniref:hypothetical protein n=1 Tax=Spirosoma sp. TaxID=1899569 RepID=UPI002611DC03|nr:hypothetical protein [Spirosoma sp.]MCX6217592.1 hypothetical protein [Spirosoma sp.]